MKKVLVMIAMMLFVSCQNDKLSEVVPETENDIRFEILSEYLELSDNQIEDLRSEFYQNKKRNHTKEKKIKRSKQMFSNLYDNLTAEQKSKLDILKDKMRKGEIPEEYITVRNNKYAEKLELTSDQKVKFFEIQSKLDGKLNSFESSDKNQRSKREELKTFHRETRKELESILSDEQLIIFNKINNRKRDHFKKSKRMKKDRFEIMKEKLNLSEEQSKELKVIFDSMRTSSKSIKDSDSSHEEKGMKLKSLKDQEVEKIKSILTPEQIKLFDDLKFKRKRRSKH